MQRSDASIYSNAIFSREKILTNKITAATDIVYNVR